MKNLNAKRYLLKAGFTLIEILVVIGMIAILATVVLIAINPARQFAQGRDSQRISNLNSILNAVGQRIADGKGAFNGTFTIGTQTHTCPTFANKATTTINITPGGAAVGDFGCLVPTYIPSLPTDPAGATAPSIGYSYYYDNDTGRLSIIATATEPTITRLAPLVVTR